MEKDIIGAIHLGLRDRGIVVLGHDYSLVIMYNSFMHAVFMHDGSLNFRSGFSSWSDCQAEFSATIDLHLDDPVQRLIDLMTEHSRPHSLDV